MIQQSIRAIIELCEGLVSEVDGPLNAEHLDLIGEICSAAAAFPPDIAGDEQLDSATRHGARGRVATILGFAGLLIEDPEGTLNPAQLEKLQEIYELGEQVLELVNQIDPVK